MNYKVIGAIGDSITNGYWDEEGLGWFGRLSQKIAYDFPLKYAFCNIAQSGDRVSDAYYRYSGDLMTRTIDILLIAVGTNDVLRGNDIEAPTFISEYGRKTYWDKLLSLALKSGSEVVVFDILPPYEVLNPFVPDENRKLYFLNKDIEKYNDMLECICSEKGVKFVKRHDKWMERDLSGLYFDVVHPNADGHRLICEEAYDELVRLKVIGDGL